MIPHLKILKPLLLGARSAKKWYVLFLGRHDQLLLKVHLYEKLVCRLYDIATPSFLQLQNAETLVFQMRYRLLLYHELLFLYNKEKVLMWFNFRSRHIALRQDHYETALLFLMRRARLDIANKNGQKPFECMPSKNPKCATIVKLTTTLQDLMKDSLKQRLERIICNDLTRGKETNPVQCVNDLDDDNDPEDYVYIKSNVVTKDIPLDRNISTLQVGLFIPFFFSIKFKLNWLKCSSGHPLFWLAFNNYVDIILPFFLNTQIQT